MRESAYDKFPRVSVPRSQGACFAGWDLCAARLRRAIQERATRRTVLVVECYPGAQEEEILRELAARLSPSLIASAWKAMIPPPQADELVAPFLGGEDPVFGFRCDLTLDQFFDAGQLARWRAEVESAREGLILVIGCGARLITRGDILVYADMPRWEGQKRFRRSEVSNLAADNKGAPSHLQYKRAFFVDWPVADRWKRTMMAEWDFVFDTTSQANPKLAAGEAVRRGLDKTVTRPFRLAPFFDPAPWGGQWMRRVCGLNGEAPNYGWCFDCVPEENSLLLELDGATLEIPSLNLVFWRANDLLGRETCARFGGEFPIRFDFLDTIGGGNLSFQVHPLAEYIRRHFGMAYTQDESYYVLDAGENASVYLGLREGIDREAMTRDLLEARSGKMEFPAERYANRFPAKKHDHFLIPAGTAHCSGANSMVLEISATPYIFTFKLWDWGRLGLDGRPRPIHLDHGLANIQWERTTSWVKEHLVNRIEPLASGPGWAEERTGLHETEFIETRRHWFTGPVAHHTHDNVNVLNLVEGREALVESPDGAFDSFAVHYAETFIVPAAVGPYTIRPGHSRGGGRFGAIKAFVRPEKAGAK
jgi:mannose-6-phosphate isomerase class I